MNSGTKALHAFRAPNFSSVVLSTLGRLGVEDAERPTATLHKIHNRPGIDVSAGFQIDFTRAGSAAADYVVVTTSEVPESEHVVRVQHQGLRFAFWLHPFDPELPGLAPACDPVVAAGWTGETSPVLKLASYRPLRRGVVRYRGERTTFAKIVRPTRVERLRARHELISEAGIAPRVLGVPAPGVLLMDSAMGSSLASALAAGLAGEQPLPDPAQLIELLDRLPVAALDLPRRDAWSDRLDFHGAAAAASLQGSAARRSASLARKLADVVRREPKGPVVPTHGDFYEANIFVHVGRPVQMIDLDAVGPGLREDDIACLLGHLSVLEDLSPRHYTGMRAVTDDWAREFSGGVRSVKGLLARVSAVVLSLVSGAVPDSRQQRLDTAIGWARRAGIVR
jgi:hypothetical protein